MMMLVATAVVAAVCGFIASAAILRNKRRARGYFILGVVTGLTAAAVTRGRYRRLSALRAFVRPRRSRSHRATARLRQIALHRA
jgi:hypothetical protein